MRKFCYSSLFFSINSKTHKRALIKTSAPYIKRFTFAIVILTNAVVIVKKKNILANTKHIAATLVFIFAPANTSYISVPNYFSDYLKTGILAVSKRSFINDFLSFNNLLNSASCLTSI